MSTVTYESADYIATITINRPQRMNALKEELIVALNAAWHRFAQSDDRVAILHAAGDRAFSVGADIKDPPKDAKILAASAPLVVQTIKKFALATLPKSPAEAGAISRAQLLRVRDSEDGAEGRSAFKDKRKPQFKGR